MIITSEPRSLSVFTKKMVRTAWHGRRLEQSYRRRSTSQADWNNIVSSKNPCIQNQNPAFACSLVLDWMSPDLCDCVALLGSHLRPN